MSDGDGDTNFDEVDVYDAPLEDEDGGVDDEEESKEKKAEEEEEEDDDDFVEETTSVLEHKKRLVGKDRVSRPIMSLYEFSRLVETYAKMIDDGARIDPRIEIKSTSSIDLAEAALKFRAPDYNFPITIIRPLPNGTEEEEWKVSELIMPHELVTHLVE